MTRYVLVSDTTLSYEYRNFPLLDFLPCAPGDKIPGRIYRFLKGPAPEALPNGELKYAPYSIRKIEASLLRKFKRNEVAVAHEDYLENFIKDDTEIIGVSTMDPLGIGPTTMSYVALFGGNLDAWVRREWDALIEKINRVRAGKKAKLIVGGPGVWEFTVLRDEIEKYKFDYIVQGEMDDLAPELFEQISEGNIDKKMFFQGYMTYDDHFRKVLKNDDMFIARGIGQRAYPALEDIPEVQRPVIKGMVEVMRGCGVGCDFCEVTLRPLRYYPLEKIKKEIEVNVAGGIDHAWLHSDEIFEYKHEKMFTPNQDALEDLFKTVMSIKGVTGTNPTHGRISIPAAFPELIKSLSEIIHAGPDNWIGIQTGVETGSDSLAMKHMPNKTMPLRIGSDGTFQEIVWQGVYNETKYYWRSAFTIQVGQQEETDEDNWDSIAMINRLSNSYVDGRPFEFTVTPLVNVPLGRIKSRNLNMMLNPVQLGVYYASYRHLAKMAARDGFSNTHGNMFVRLGTGSVISIGGTLMLKVVEKIARKHGVDIDKVKRYGIENNSEISSLSMLARA
ncbi:B12-binding domain-containing radical SAM protein [Picrophilus oshimae]|uniref:Fe-S oxidoreductase n=1 Tax=Picrophilus torridus (strain ATCC 700027 / DSM 9790 / JCM 10055 / NBRC 100828 / KAW 2/3) TaxID=1122961 RepID=Q6KZD8_PICTO|nr:radical SAM protein [Picrophilus oshimae]AAT43914.1 Fe-S oxidoreductase [Picrophilus oshimae DSM 9789]